MLNQTASNNAITEGRGEESKRKIFGIRTLKTDTAEYVKDKKISLIDVAAAESKKGGLVSETKTEKLNFKKLTLILLATIAVGAIAFGGYWFFIKEESDTRQASFSAKPILVADETVEIIAIADDPRNFLAALRGALETPTRISSFLHVSIVKELEEGGKRSITTKEFFNFAGIKAYVGIPDYIGDRFMLSKFYFSKEWPILIFKISSYDHVFPGMFKWESSMAEDFQEIFSIENIGNSKGFFEDREIQNRDTRVLYDTDGNVLLIYSFIGKDYMVITVNEEPIKEIYRRFASPQYLNE